MTTIAYENLALDWSPKGKGDSSFAIILTACLVFIVVIGIFLSTIELPPEERKARTSVPERIAQLVLEQKKQKPPPPKPKPKPEPKPVVKPKPRVKKQPEKQVEKPLTKKQKKAREKAQDTGLLALGNELADLIDTSGVDALVASKVSKGSGSAKTASSLDKTVLSENVGKGSGGISADEYTAPQVSSGTLSAQEVTSIRQSLLKKKPTGSATQSSSKTSTTTVESIRAEEEITLVFDQNKGKLYSIYNRERRRNPGLKGKIVLDITIAPDGRVTAVKIISSELNNPKLERSLIARIKLFKFSSGKTDSVTITYPIEFLPS